MRTIALGDSGRSIFILLRIAHAGRRGEVERVEVSNAGCSQHALKPRAVQESILRAPHPASLANVDKCVDPSLLEGAKKCLFREAVASDCQNPQRRLLLSVRLA